MGREMGVVDRHFAGESPQCPKMEERMNKKKEEMGRSKEWNGRMKMEQNRGRLGREKGERRQRKSTDDHPSKKERKNKKSSLILIRTFIPSGDCAGVSALAHYPHPTQTSTSQNEIERVVLSAEIYRWMYVRPRPRPQ